MENKFVSKAPVITIDGPSGAGKGTIAAVLSEALHWHLLDSGALYRLTALACLQQQIDITDIARIVYQAENLAVKFVRHPNTKTNIFLNNQEVSNNLQNEQLGMLASQVAQIVAVRQALLRRQQAFRQMPGLVADGRDMGTVVFPDAIMKFFLTASAKERARRRFEQLRQSGQFANMAQLIKEMQERDKRDQNRAIAPLKPATDAIIIDTTTMSLQKVLQRMRSLLMDKAINLPPFAL